MESEVSPVLYAPPPHDPAPQPLSAICISSPEFILYVAVIEPPPAGVAAGLEPDALAIVIV